MQEKISAISLARLEKYSLSDAVTEVEQILISGKKFKKLRRELVFTQQEMAEEIGMSVSGLRAIERKPASKVGNKYIRALANLRKIPPSQQQAELAFGAGESSESEKSVGAELIEEIGKAIDHLTREEMLSIVKLMRRGLHAIRPNINRITIRETTSGR